MFSACATARLRVAYPMLGGYECGTKMIFYPEASFTESVLGLRLAFDVTNS